MRSLACSSEMFSDANHSSSTPSSRSLAMCQCICVKVHSWAALVRLSVMMVLVGFAGIKDVVV